MPDVTDSHLSAALRRDSGRVADGRRALVLASGGIDSTALLYFAKAERLETSALFVDFGQPAVLAERRAIEQICRDIEVELRTVRYSGTSFGPGEVPGRNAFLFHTAFMEFTGTAGIILAGLHAGTGYRDCSPEFLKVVRQSFDFHADGRIAADAPFVNLNKQEVYDLAIGLGVPIDATYSCEAGPDPCLSCASCLDRLALLKAGSGVRR